MDDDPRDRRTPRHIRLQSAGGTVTGEIDAEHEPTDVYTLPSEILLRKTYERTKRLSESHKTLAGQVKVLGVDVQELGRDVRDLSMTIVDETSKQNEVLGRLATTRYEMVAHQEKSDITVRETQATASITDAVDKRKSRRALVIAIVKGIAAVLGGGGLFAMLERLGGC